MVDDLAMRTPHRLTPDPHRVITKLFVPGEEAAHSPSRARAVITRILAMSDAEVTSLTDAIIAGFRGRHSDLTGTFSRHFTVIAHEVPPQRRLSAERRMLIGACFTHEYSPEAGALFNPSMAPHPDQSDLAAGQVRFVMTVRCVGEGHLSSIGFRTGILGPGTALVLHEPDRALVTGASRPATNELTLLMSRLADNGDDPGTVRAILGFLPEAFTSAQLGDALTRIHEHTLNRERVQQTIEHIRQLATATYDLEYPTDSSLSERLLWPRAPMESHGMEDARLVRFVEPDGAVTYYATYTAFDGAHVGSHLLATTDFRHFHISPMAGRAARNKGLALFPRRIRDRYHALSRWDRESISLVASDNCRIWSEPSVLYRPRHGWELIQVGNCGSPIETPAGWLVLTHGVGPMRTYAMGALLLDLDDPSVVLASLREPLLSANADERDGYVPNVVYSCGAMLHDDTLTIPYGISDGAIGFAQIGLERLLSRMLAVGGTAPRSTNGSRSASDTG
jgi:predicted GH43/DUF377 family glycosyl hydrolase